MTEKTQEKVTAEVPDLTKRDKIDTYIRSTFCSAPSTSSVCKPLVLRCR